MTVSRRWVITVGALAVAVLVLTLLVAAQWAPLGSLDEAAALGVNALMAPHDGLTVVVGGITDIGMSRVVQVLTGLAVVGSLLARRYRAALYLLVCWIVEYVLENGLKHVVGRERPVVPVPLATASGGSFPSGHTMGTAVLWISLAVVLAPLIGRRSGRVVVASVVALVVVAVAVSRVLLGVHFPSDVLGGLLLGVLVALVMAPLAGAGWAPILRPEPEDVETGPLPVIRFGRRLAPRSQRSASLRLVPGPRTEA